MWCAGTIDYIASNLHTYLFCCSSTVTDGRVTDRRPRQEGSSLCRGVHRPSRAARPSFDPFASPGTSPTPDSPFVVLRMPGILESVARQAIVIPMQKTNDKFGRKYTTEENRFQVNRNRTFLFFEQFDVYCPMN